MKAIQTRYYGPTNTRGSRIKAWAEGVGSVSIPYPHELSGEDVHRGTDDQGKSNARLIAAAPDLLSALEECLPDLKHYVSTHGPGPDRRLATAIAAIARATKV